MFPSRCRSDLGARAQFALGNMLFDQGSQGLACFSKVSWLNRDRNREYFQRPGNISFYCFPVRLFDEALSIFEPQYSLISLYIHQYFGFIRWRNGEKEANIEYLKGKVKQRKVTTKVEILVTTLEASYHRKRWWRKFSWSGCADYGKGFSRCCGLALFLKLHGVCKKARLVYDTQSDQSAQCCKSFQKSIERRFKNSASFYLDHVGTPEKRSLEF